MNKYFTVSDTQLVDAFIHNGTSAMLHLLKGYVVRESVCGWRIIDTQGLPFEPVHWMRAGLSPSLTYDSLEELVEHCKHVPLIRELDAV
jgi:hypothetical protein